MRLRIAVLTSFVALGIVGMVSADEEASGPWYSRWFANSAKSETEPAKTDGKKSTLPAAPPVSNLQRFRKAQAIWDRRIKVCHALRQIADDRDDDELRRKVEMLELRIQDAYVAATPFGNRPGSSLSSKSASSLEKSAKEAR